MISTAESRRAATAAGSLPIGQVLASPQPFSILGRLKAIVDAVMGSGPATRAVAIVTGDGVDLPAVPKGIYVGTGGDITMIGVDAPANAVGVTWKNVSAGSLIPFRARRILATGTTAANMLALY